MHLHPLARARNLGGPTGRAAAGDLGRRSELPVAGFPSGCRRPMARSWCGNWSGNKRTARPARDRPGAEVWTDEARDFTPWLLQNVDVLSELLRMDLSLDVAEHPVGSFRLDLKGRDEATDQVVIVENQLELSDHSHLGQLITYAAGTDPTTIVWIATGFREEHRKAIEWLNDRTDEYTRFFAVEIQVVTIGNSQPPPTFKLVAQPNDWAKHVRAATVGGTGEVSARQQLYWDFWEGFRQRVLTVHPDWTWSTQSTRSSGFAMSAGTSDATWSSTFTRNGIGVQLVLEGPRPGPQHRPLRRAPAAARRDGGRVWRPAELGAAGNLQVMPVGGVP